LIIPVALISIFLLVVPYIYYFGPVYGFPPGFSKFPPFLFSERYHKIGNWCEENLLEGSKVAIGEIGIIPYFGEFYVIDLFGLTDPHIAKLPGGWNEKVDLEYLRKRNPDYYILPEIKTGPGEDAVNVYRYVAVLLGDSKFQEDYNPINAWGDIKIYQRRDLPPLIWESTSNASDNSP
jgi:hypothetical protein